MFGLAAALVGLDHAEAQSKAGGDVPVRFERLVAARDDVERTVMIPMRDGVKLNTIILLPNGAKRAPIVLSRIPYHAKARTNPSCSPKP